ncbi:MAG: hypothetical protein HOW73_46305 [Polyangiaceae bacterium]|nr:hypothetical protein [Polyangiaceae bacterium]
MTTAPTQPGQPALVLRDVVARDAAGAKATARGMLYGVSLDLGATDVAVVGAIEDGTLALAEVLVGRFRPDRGTVRVQGKDPFNAVELRCRIASIGIDPALPLAASVLASVDLATSAWPSPVAAADVLARFGLGALGPRAVASLTASEVRAVEIALALAIPDPALVVALEPFADLSMVPRARLEEALAERARVCPVVAITSSPADAKRFGRSVVLHRGAFARSTEGAHAGLAPALDASLTVWVSSGARELVAALSRDPAASSIAFDATTNDADAHATSGILRVSGKDADALALAIADATRASGAAVTAVAEGAPGLAEVRAATEHELRSRQLASQQMRALEMQAQAQMMAMQRAQMPGPYGMPAPGAQPYGYGGAPQQGVPAPPAFSPQARGKEEPVVSPSPGTGDKEPPR